MSTNNRFIVVKSKITSNEFKIDFIKKLKNICSGYDIAFIESSKFENMEIFPPHNIKLPNILI